MWVVSRTNDDLAYDHIVESRIAGGGLIGYLACFADEEARRIVACVNTCQGFATEELEGLARTRRADRYYNICPDLGDGL